MSTRVNILVHKRIPIRYLVAVSLGPNFSRSLHIPSTTTTTSTPRKRRTKKPAVELKEGKEDLDEQYSYSFSQSPKYNSYKPFKGKALKYSKQSTQYKPYEYNKPPNTKSTYSPQGKKLYIRKAPTAPNVPAPQTKPISKQAARQQNMYSFRIINHPTSDLRQPQILLQTVHGKKYLFGKSPEGLQRSFNEQKVSLSNFAHIFFTGVFNWETIGGFPGLVLTLSDRGNKVLNLYHGNPLINYVISTWRYFVFRFGMDLQSKVMGSGENYEDEIMKVRSVNIIRDKAAPQTQESKSRMDSLATIISKMFPKNPFTNHPIPIDETDPEFMKEMYKSDPTMTDPYIHVALPEASPNDISTCYSIQLSPVRGKFNPKKAKELGIPEGPMFAQLAKGQTITLKDGTVVEPSMVVAEQRCFKRVLVVDCPGNSFINGVKSHDWMSTDTAAAEEDEEVVGLVYHLLGEEIDLSEGSAYHDFILNSFPEETLHYISHPSYCYNSIVFKKAAMLTLKLKALQPSNYNLPESSQAALSLPKTLQSRAKPIQQGQIINIESEIKAKLLEAKPKYDNSLIPASIKSGENPWGWFYDQIIKPLNITAQKDQVINTESVCLENVDRSVSLRDQVEVITLGTGSAIPSDHRNVSSNLVRIPYVNDSGEILFQSMLLDGGENTIGTICRTLGLQNMNKYFKELKLIYLSHLHADHHLGIISIINEWMTQNKDDNEARLYLVTPWQYDHFVKEWMSVEGHSSSDLNKLKYISCEDFLQGKPREEVAQLPYDQFLKGPNEATGQFDLYPVPFERNKALINEFYNDMGLFRLSTCRAIHCSWAYSVTFDFALSSSESFRCSYSGDTRPNFYMFAEVIGQNSDLLIHEATLSNDLFVEAQKKRHCTINEAIQVSNKMNAKHLILTHFSQRYPQLPEIGNNVDIKADYCFAFDSMIVKMNEVKEQKTYFKDFEKLFRMEKEEVLLEDKKNASEVIDQGKKINNKKNKNIKQ